MEDTQTQNSTEIQESNMGSKNMLYVALGVGLLLVVGGAIVLKSQKAPSTMSTTSLATPTTATDQTSTASDLLAQPSASTTTSAQIIPGGKVKVFNVAASSFAFNPSQIKVNKGDTVRIVLTNTSGNHDWVLDEFAAKTQTIQAGQTDQVEFTASKTGTFEYYCSVANHRQMGMVGKLIVQ